MRIRVASIALALLVATVLTVPAQGAVKAVKATRYSLQGKCLTLGGATGKAVPGASRLRFKATDLGRYLLYLPDRRFLGANGSASAPATAPSDATTWITAGVGRGRFVLRPASASNTALTSTGALGSPSSPAARLLVKRATGCAVYPEASLDAKGTRPRPRPPTARSAGSSRATCTG